MQPTTKPSKKQRATAYHEAGHAVVAIHFHRELEMLSIVANEVSRGHVTLSSPAPFDPQRKNNLANVEREIMILLAGGLAEKRLHVRKRQVGSAADERLAWDLARKAHGNEKVIQSFLLYLSARAGAVLDFWWSAVEALANELIENKELSGRHAKRIFQAAVRKCIRSNHNRSSASSSQ